jgi:hypothetical protein
MTQSGYDTVAVFFAQISASCVAAEIALWISLAHAKEDMQPLLHSCRLSLKFFF